MDGVWLTDEHAVRLARDAVALGDSPIVGSVREAEAETVTLNVALDVGAADGSVCVAEAEVFELTLDVGHCVDEAEVDIEKVVLGHPVAL